MLSSVFKVTGAAVIGALAIYAGYRVVDGQNAGSAPSAEDSTTSVATVDGVPEGMEPTAFDEGQRGDRVAVAETADTPLMAENGTAQEAQNATTGQLRGLPQRDEDTRSDAPEQSADDNTAPAEDTSEAKAKGEMTRNPVVADKKDKGGFTTNPVVADKKDFGTGFTTNPRLVDKKDDGGFTTTAQSTEFDPCLKADGTPYQGPGTALNPFAPVNPCLPKATAESYAELLPEVPEIGTVPDRELPTRPTHFGPEPPTPPSQGGSDYRTI